MVKQVNHFFAWLWYSFLLTNFGIYGFRMIILKCISGKSHGNAKNIVKATLINIDFINRRLAGHVLEARIEL